MEEFTVDKRYDPSKYIKSFKYLKQPVRNHAVEKTNKISYLIKYVKDAFKSLYWRETI